MPELGLFGIVDAVDGRNGARVTSEGSLTQRIVGADGVTAVAAVVDQPKASDPGLVVKSADLCDVKDLLRLILNELVEIKELLE